MSLGGWAQPKPDNGNSALANEVAELLGRRTRTRAAGVVRDLKATRK